MSTRRGIVTVAMEATALLGMSPFLYIEACTVIEYGPRRWLSIWNLMDLATYFLQVHAVASHVVSSHVFHHMFSIACFSITCFFTTCFFFTCGHGVYACMHIRLDLATWCCMYIPLRRTCVDEHTSKCTAMDMNLCNYMPFCTSAVLKCSTQVLYSSALLKCSTQVLYSSALLKCSTQVLYSSALLKCCSHVSSLQGPAGQTSRLCE